MSSIIDLLSKVMLKESITHYLGRFKLSKVYSIINQISEDHANIITVYPLLICAEMTYIHLSIKGS